MSDVQAAWVLFEWPGFEFSSVCIWLLVSEVQNSGSDEQNGLGVGGAGCKLAQGHSGNVGTCKKLAIECVIGFPVRIRHPSWDGAASMDKRGMEDPGTGGH